MRNPRLVGEVLEYEKRISPFAKLDIVEVSSASFCNDSEIEKAKTTEGERIQKVISKRQGRVMLLDEGGKEMNSKEFVSFLTGRSEPLILVIGGTAGLSTTLKKTYTSISLSRLTLPHELARVVLLEQLYRAVTMQQKRNKYHY